MDIAQEPRLVASRYRLEREIGRGGMGAVWLGTDQVLGREVALKRIGLLPGDQRPDLERAEREARLAARLNHPHVVGVFDLIDEDEDTWLVMEYVEGITLGALVRRDGALTPDEAAPLVRQAADALAAAHGAGIVHRDVKPSNILVTSAGTVKLTDFGIARAEADSTLTRTGLVTGSPAYLAPEVASGASASEASDVWSLGTTLYHVLAGRPPYDVNENLMAAMYRIVHEDPPRLPDAGWLAPALEHTMARDPQDRWTMAELRDFLSQPEPVAIHPAPLVGPEAMSTPPLQTTASELHVVPPIPPVPGLALPRRRSPWPWVAAGVVLLAAGVILVAVLAGLRSGGGSPQTTPPSPGSGGHSPATSPAGARSDPATSMRAFVTTYLSEVTADQHATWAMLTPSFQAASGGFGHYQGFWRTISTATPRDVRADPQGMTVSYAVDYVRMNGSTASDQVTLHLVRHGTSYLIDGES